MGIGSLDGYGRVFERFGEIVIVLGVYVAVMVVRGFVICYGLTGCEKGK